MQLYPRLDTYIKRLLEEASKIPDNRKEQLKKLADYILSNKLSKLNFICTHNSRRSHIAQIWAAAGAAYFGIPDVQTFSGGTEATAFNPRAVSALERAGFQIEKPEGKNPSYEVAFSEEVAPLICYSKTFDNPANPSSDFAAIMTCSDADENCPFIPGVAFRLPLTYDDPKAADDTPEEVDRYDERVQQIGREILYAMQLAAQKPK
jgi:arsenate reductase